MTALTDPIQLLPPEHVVCSPFQLALPRLIWQTLLELPPNRKPSSQVKVQASLAVGILSSPNEQSMFPLAGAVSEGHAIHMKHKL